MGDKVLTMPVDRAVDEVLFHLKKTFRAEILTEGQLSAAKNSCEQTGQDLALAQIEDPTRTNRKSEEELDTEFRTCQCQLAELTALHEYAHSAASTAVSISKKFGVDGVTAEQLEEAKKTAVNDLKNNTFFQSILCYSRCSDPGE